MVLLRKGAPCQRQSPCWLGVDDGNYVHAAYKYHMSYPAALPSPLKLQLLLLLLVWLLFLR